MCCPCCWASDVVKGEIELCSAGGVLGDISGHVRMTAKLKGRVSSTDKLQHSLLLRDAP